MARLATSTPMDCGSVAAERLALSWCTVLADRRPARAFWAERGAGFKEDDTDPVWSALDRGDRRSVGGEQFPCPFDALQRVFTPGSELDA